MCENNSIFEQNHTISLLLLKRPILAVLALRGNLYFPDFLQKIFITSTTGLGSHPPLGVLFFLHSLFGRLK